MRKVFLQLEYRCVTGNESCWMNARIFSVGIRDNQPIDAHKLMAWYICKRDQGFSGSIQERTIDFHGAF